jgi:hypothetical protein
MSLSAKPAAKSSIDPSSSSILGTSTTSSGIANSSTGASTCISIHSRFSALLSHSLSRSIPTSSKLTVSCLSWISINSSFTLSGVVDISSREIFCSTSFVSSLSQACESSPLAWSVLASSTGASSEVSAGLSIISSKFRSIFVSSSTTSVSLVSSFVLVSASSEFQKSIISSLLS